MSHEIAFDTSRAQHMCFTAGEPAWHKLGQNVKDAVNWSEAMKLAGLDWIVEKEELFDKNHVVVPGFGVIRQDNRQCLGIVGAVYEPLQNRFAFDFVDTLVGAEEGNHYESAGALYQGQRIWCLARVPKGDAEIVPGDLHQTYLLFTSSHDGGHSSETKVVTTRVVCHNTLSAALREAGVCFKIRHTPSAQEKLSYAKQFLAGAVEKVADVRAKLRELAEREVTKESFTAALDRLFPVPKKQEKGSARRDNVLSEILQLYELNDGDQGIASIRGTGYNLLNAVTQWTDHVRGVRITEKRTGMTEATARADNAMFGTGDDLKTSALEVILEATANGPHRSYVQTFKSAELPKTGFGGVLDSVLDQPIKG